MKKISYLLFFFIFYNFTSHGQEKLDSGKLKQIVFVCEHGAAKSAIASAYFNKLAKEKGLNYISVFRGITIDSVLSPAAKSGLQKDGFATKSWIPSTVSQKDIDASSALVTFDCTLPKELTTHVVSHQWQKLPSVSENYETSRQAILKQVEGLIQELTE